MTKLCATGSMLILNLISIPAFSQNGSSNVLPVTPSPPPISNFQPSSVDPKIPVYMITKAVLKNESRVVGFTVFLNPDCSPAEPLSVKIIENPKHGKLKVEPGEDFTHYLPANPLSVCNSKKVKGLKVHYLPNENFSGTDFFRALLIMADGSAMENAMKIIVIE